MAAGDLIAASITAKTLTDLETQAALKDAANVFTRAAARFGAGDRPRLALIDTGGARRCAAVSTGELRSDCCMFARSNDAATAVAGDAADR